MNNKVNAGREKVVRQFSTQLVNRYAIDNSSGGLTAAIVARPVAILCHADETCAFDSKFSRYG